MDGHGLFPPFPHAALRIFVHPRFPLPPHHTYRSSHTPHPARMFRRIYSACCVMFWKTIFSRSLFFVSVSALLLLMLSSCHSQPMEAPCCNEKKKKKKKKKKEESLNASNTLYSTRGFPNAKVKISCKHHVSNPTGTTTRVRAALCHGSSRLIPRLQT
ncbi:uncharacterized protein IWZ02DRAFT_49409 [Phyllosticta citriasiana]|uniref:uncharacterized protein n=1 Tax=Phyllosticta citriasiana TaxID=595635 RepID=UPI0030FD4017